jgi:cytochrome c553
MYPKIAGQHESYLLKQLLDYKRASETGGAEGRNNAIMSAQVMFLSEQDMADLAAYFAAQTAEGGEAPEDIIAAAEKLYRGGDVERKIPSCAACHGPRGDGMGLANFPDISGQHATYTIDQLKQFRSGQRANDPNGMMRDVAAKLTDADMDVLAKYLQGLY